jgi:hypothetical protein
MNEESKQNESQTKKTRKNKMEILNELKNFIDETAGNKFYRSDIKNMDPRTAEIEFCQWNLPIIQILETDKLLVRILERRDYIDTGESLFNRSISQEDASSIRKELQVKLDSRRLSFKDSLRKTKGMTHDLQRLTDDNGDLKWMKTPAARNLFQCTECEELVRWPMHCLEVMTLKEDGEKLICEQCKVTVDFPEHCGKTMNIKIIKM